MKTLLVVMMFIVTIIFSTIYIIFQQILIHQAVEPQIQIAQDISNLIMQGAVLDNFIPAVPTELSTTSSPFIIMYTLTGSPLASSVEIDGKVPVMPPDVFKNINSNELKALTWQIENSGDYAVVVMPFMSGMENGYIVVGKSLQATEQQLFAILIGTLIGWGLSMVALIAAGYSFKKKLFSRLFPKKQNRVGNISSRPNFV